MSRVPNEENNLTNISLGIEQICKHFSLDAIRSATLNFDEELVIGRGGFGNVYKGHIHPGSGTVVAIKRLHSMSNQGAPEFQAEIETLSKLRHCNLVSLIGYCSEGAEMALVYDYMPQGTLEDHLHKAGASLSWLQRLKICIGAARGLEYLHTGTGTQQGIIHRDVKSSNILLDENFAAKISDFGLAKTGPTNQTRTYVSTGVKGTFGYMDPCYFYTGKLTRKSDVYSLGVVLLEVIFGRPAVDSSLDEAQWGLAIWAQDRIKEGKLTCIIDSKLKGQVSSNCLKKFAHIACRCLNNQPSQRPTMAEIIARLEFILSLQERLDSSVTDGKLIDRLWSFIPAKGKLKANKKIVSAHKLDNASVTPETSAVNSYCGLIHFDEFSFTAEDIVQAKQEVISKTSYGPSYLATMKSGEQIMTRQIMNDMIRKEDTDFLRKIHALGELRHANILTLKGCYCSNEDTHFITDYIKNGSLAAFIQSSRGQQPKVLLGWWFRMKIIVGIARGLTYLHTQRNTVHGYLTSGNVLLDVNFNPLISDVGLSLLTTDAKPDSPIDHAPELLKFKDANIKTDIYSLGLIMLEILTGKSSITSYPDAISLPRQVMSIPRHELRKSVFDPKLKRKKSNIIQYLVRVLELAMACVSLVPNARPEAYEVLQQLEEIVSIARNVRE